MIAPPKQLMGLEFSRNHLNRPPERPKHDVELLSDLCQRQSLQLHGEAGDTPQDHWLLTPPWPQGVDLLPIPEEPYLLDGLKLCFHDELIGVDDALLIHYGPSQYEVNGYHPVISALSVPIEVELSALIILRMERREAQRWVDFPLTRERETCVIHISAQGALIKGPWWPKLNVPSRQGEHGSTLG